MVRQVDPHPVRDVWTAPDGTAAEPAHALPEPDAPKPDTQKLDAPWAEPEAVDPEEPPDTPGASPTAGELAPPPNPALRFASQVLTIVAVLALSFVTQLTLTGAIQHDRDQTQAFRELRIQLAKPTAPVSSVEQDGKPLASGTPVGILEIPRLKLQEVLLEGSSPQVLMSGPGHRRDTVLPGQVGTSVILGRRGAYGGPFRNLQQLRAGDEIVVTTGQGRHTFAVLGIRHANDPFPRARESGQGRLTLATADGPVFRPTDVLWVDAKLTSQAQPAGPQIPSRALPANEAIMANDDSALLPLMLWGPLLVVAAVGTVWVRYRTGRWQAWAIGLPVLALLGMLAMDDVAALLPNVL